MSPPPRADIDESQLAELATLRAEGGGEIVRDLVGMFLRDTAERLEALGVAARAADAPTVRAVAHKLKGSSGIVGARRLVTLCAALEAQTSLAGVDEACRALDAEFALVRAWFEGRLWT